MARASAAGKPRPKAAKPPGAGRVPLEAAPRDAIKDAPRAYAMRPVGALVPALTRPAFRRVSPAATTLMADWAAIVGPALARVTAPRRLVRGTLTIGASGPVALELQHMSGEVLARINLHLGQGAVDRLRFVRDSVTPTPWPAPVPPPAAPRGKLAPDPPLDGLPQGELRNALAALGRAVASRG